MNGLRTRQARTSWSTGLFGLHDGFHYSPTPLQNTPSPTFPGRGACGKQAAVLYTSLEILPVLLVYIAQRRCAHISPDVLARLGSSIASMKALDHAYVPRVFIFRHDAREANQLWWFIYGLNTPPVVY